MLTEAFKKWANRVRFGTNKVKRGMKWSYPFYEKPERDLMDKIKAVNEERRPGIYGASILGSKVIKLNPTTLGDDKLMWATTAVHEAEHGVNGVLEGGATEREFRFLGRVYKNAVQSKNRVMAKRALKAAAIAMNQRKRMVDDKYKKDDKQLLMDYGFSEKAANVLMEV